MPAAMESSQNIENPLGIFIFLQILFKMFFFWKSRKFSPDLENLLRDLAGRARNLSARPKSSKSQNEDISSDSGTNLTDDVETVTNGFEYKIGDLGHIAPVHGGEMSPEEGDCRYMAPEFLEMEMDRSHLTKADIFSLGLSLYEAASLKPLPRNSMDDSKYENIHGGDLPYLDMYSREFNNLLRSMVNPDPRCRPSAAKIFAGRFLNPGMNKSSVQLYHERRETKEKIYLLEQQLLAKLIKGN